MKFIVALLLTLLIAGCSTMPGSADSNLQEMAAALIRDQLSSDATYLRQNSRNPFFVSVGDVDISAATISKLSGQGLTIFPGSAWHEGNGMRMGIALPTLRSDGDFDVVHSYYCGVRCSSLHRAVMRRTGKVWSVVSSSLVLIGLVPVNDGPQYPART